MTAPPSQHDELFEKWREWLALVHDQVVGMFHNRQIWREMRAALEAKDGRVFLITTQACTSTARQLQFAGLQTRRLGIERFRLDACSQTYPRTVG